MNIREKNFLFILALLLLLILYYSRILFTSQIIRAPDIVNEYFWYALDLSRSSLASHFTKIVGVFTAPAGWNLFENSGSSVGGGTNSLQLMGFRDILYWLIPLPTSIAWYIVAHLLFGAVGTYYCCRVIGTTAAAALFGAAIFAFAPETATLINAGHVMKLATISFAPWAFYFLERGFQSRRLFYFMASAVVLAFQFFNMHWQIAFYTCLCAGAYGLFRLAGIARSGDDSGQKEVMKLLGMNAILLIFFLSTVAISLLPLANWSKDTNRGVQSGANQTAQGVTKGGLDVEEAMAWSLPPEELAALVVPGMFGLSRQEAGRNPENIDAYYWGRMRFTQTASYLGILPWLLLPLPLIYKRDRYTWLLLGGVIGGILFSMGRYTPFYWLLYDYFPGINHFRVPKMMMFIPLLAIALLAARGIDIISDEKLRGTRGFFRYLCGVAALPLLLLLLLGVEAIGTGQFVRGGINMLSEPTRYESGLQLVMQRWNNLMMETGIAAAASALYAATFWLLRSQRGAGVVLPLLLLLFLVDTWRINDKFLFLVDPPVRSAGGELPAQVKLLSSTPRTSRVLPLDGSDPMLYVSAGIPVMFTPNAVQQTRWQQFLDRFTLDSAMPDMMNVKHLVIPSAEYQVQPDTFNNRYRPVLNPADGGAVVLENRRVLPKGWLVSTVIVEADQQRRLEMISHPSFDAGKLAVVEAAPTLPLKTVEGRDGKALQNVNVIQYEGEKILLEVDSPNNALLVLGEKQNDGWRVEIDGAGAEIVTVNHLLRGVYIPSGNHRVEFKYDPLPFKIGKFLTLSSLLLFLFMLFREWRFKRGGD